MTKEKTFFPDRPLREDEVQGTFIDVIDLFCQFSQKLELLVNTPGYKFLQQRMGYLREEVEELQQAISQEDDVEILDGAIDTAFVALTQGYLVLRARGFGHTQSLVKLRSAMIQVGISNMLKEPPDFSDTKIKKPEGWQAPDLSKAFRTSEEIQTTHNLSPTPHNNSKSKEKLNGK